MKVLFLDIDGVLNTYKRFSNQLERRKGTYVLCPIACGKLISFVEENDIKIVLSSTWRLHEDHVLFLTQAGILDNTHQDWRTVSLKGTRGLEINEWLNRHPEIEEYVIIDDNSDMLSEQFHRFIQTNGDDGLDDGHINRLRSLFHIEE